MLTCDCCKCAASEVERRLDDLRPQECLQAPGCILVTYNVYCWMGYQGAGHAMAHGLGTGS